MNIYSVFDKKAGVYNVPFFLQNNALAVRAFADLVNHDDSMISRFPEDFALYNIGSYDDKTGVCKSLIPAVFMNNATEFVKKLAVKK